MKKPSDITIVPLGTVVRQHGLSKNSLKKWKIELFVPGGEVFKDLKRLYFFDAPSDERWRPRPQAELGAEECRLEFPCEALGAKWGSAPAILMTLPEPQNPLQKMVGVARSDFPQAEDFYICDLLGRELLDAASKNRETYSIEELANASRVAGIDSWILKIQSTNSHKSFEVPLQPLLDDPKIFGQIHPATASPIEVPDLKNWIESFLDQGDHPDDE